MGRKSRRWTEEEIKHVRSAIRRYKTAGKSLRSYVAPLGRRLPGRTECSIYKKFQQLLSADRKFVASTIGAMGSDRG